MKSYILIPQKSEFSEIVINKDKSSAREKREFDDTKQAKLDKSVTLPSIKKFNRSRLIKDTQIVVEC